MRFLSSCCTPILGRARLSAHVDSVSVAIWSDWEMQSLGHSYVRVYFVVEGRRSNRSFDVYASYAADAQATLEGLANEACLNEEYGCWRAIGGMRSSGMWYVKWTFELTYFLL